MRYSLVLTMAILLFTACKKDKFTTAPQITFKSVKPDVIDNLSASPVITIGITDSEGDIGKTASNTAFIYLKNLLINQFDSVPFPDLQSAAKRNFEAEVDISVPNSIIKCNSLPGGALHTDTIYFEIYVKDFAKNKSNVITTSQPVYFICQ